jgi:hypothetical protein
VWYLHCKCHVCIEVTVALLPSQCLLPYCMKLVCLCFYPQDPTGFISVTMPVPFACFFTVRTQCNRTLRNVDIYIRDHMASNLRFHRREEDTNQKNYKQLYVCLNWNGTARGSSVSTVTGCGLNNGGYNELGM